MGVVRMSEGSGWADVFVSDVGRAGGVARENNRDTEHKFTVTLTGFLTLSRNHMYQ